MQVKICGIKTKNDLKKAVKTRADEVGFVVGIPTSPRNISFSKAKKLLKGNKEKKVIVTLAENAERIIKELNPEILQVHGGTKREWKRIMKIAGKIEIRRALKADEKVINELKNLRKCKILLDYGITGGTGKTPDWKICKKIVQEAHSLGMKVILAGGLTPGNVKKAIKIVKPDGVDVASGVETKRKKDFSKIKKFIINAKQLP